MRETFGRLLSKYRRESHDPKRGGQLTQQRLAELIAEKTEGKEDNDYPNPATVHNWEQDKNLPDPLKRRNVIVALISALVECRSLATLEQANRFLAAGGYAQLNSKEKAQIWGIKAQNEDGPKTAPGSRPSSSERPRENLALGTSPLPFAPEPSQVKGPHQEAASSGSSEAFVVRGLAGSPVNHEEEIRWTNQIVRPTSLDRSSKPGNAPRPPTLIIGRDDDLRALKSRFGVGRPRPSMSRVQVVTAERPSEGTQKANLAAVRGWPGVGKTTLAAALAYDMDAMAAFPDGVLWVSLGQTPNVLSELATWGRALATDLSFAKTAEEASAQLAALLRDKRRLLIIDDVWRAADALPFQVGGAGCGILITTRDRGVAHALAPTVDDIYRLDVLTDEKALELLQRLAPSVVVKYPKESRELVRELEGLPLAIQVAGHLLQAEAELGFSVVQLLASLREGAALLQADAPADRMDLARETTPTVAALLKKSTDLLDPNTRECFAYLGPFAPKPATFDLAALQAVWQMKNPKPVVRVLVDRGLLEPVPETGRFQMHALLVMHARTLLTKD